MILLCGLVCSKCESVAREINKMISNEPEVEYHKDNEAFLKTVLSEFKTLTGEADA